MEKTQLFQNSIQSELPPGLKTRFDRKQVMAITFSPDGTRLAAGGDGRIWIYDTATGAQFAMLSGYTEHMRALAFAPDNSLLASGSEDNTLRLWDTATAREVLTLAGDSNLVNALASSSPDGVPLPDGIRAQSDYLLPPLKLQDELEVWRFHQMEQRWRVEVRMVRFACGKSKRVVCCPLFRHMTDLFWLWIFHPKVRRWRVVVRTHLFGCGIWKASTYSLYYGGIPTRSMR